MFWEKLVDKIAGITGGKVISEFEHERLQSIEETWRDIFRVCIELGWDVNELGTAHDGILRFIRGLAERKA